MTDNPIDQTIYDQLKDAAGAEFVVELVNTFLEEAPVMLADLRSALVASDADRFRRAAHSLKSNASVFGAQDLAHPARDLELLSLDRPPSELLALLEKTEAEYARAAAALTEMQNG